MDAHEQYAALVEALAELRDEYADDGAAVFNGLQVGDALDDILRTYTAPATPTLEVVS